MKRGLMAAAAVVIAVCPMLIAGCTATTGPATSSRTPDLPGGVIHRGSGTPAAVYGPTGSVEPAASPVLVPPRR
jgi:hypothetical protein